DAGAVEQVGPVPGAVDPRRDHVLRRAVAPRDVLGRGAGGVAGALLALHEVAAVRAGVVEVVAGHHVRAVRAGGGDEAAVDVQRAAAVGGAERVGQRDDLVLQRVVATLERLRGSHRLGRRGLLRRLGGRLRLLLLFLRGGAGGGGEVVRAHRRAHGRDDAG